MTQQEEYKLNKLLEDSSKERHELLYWAASMFSKSFMTHKERTNINSKINSYYNKKDKLAKPSDMRFYK